MHFGFFHGRGKKRKLKNHGDHSAEFQSQQALPKIEVTDVDTKLPDKCSDAVCLLPTVTRITKDDSESDGEISKANNPPDVVKASKSAGLKMEVLISNSLSQTDIEASNKQAVTMSNALVEINDLKNSGNEIANTDRDSRAQKFEMTGDLDIDTGNFRDHRSAVQEKVLTNISSSVDVTDKCIAEANDCKSLHIYTNSVGPGINFSESHLTRDQNVNAKDCNSSELAQNTHIQSDASLGKSVADNMAEVTDFHNTEVNSQIPIEQLSLQVRENEAEAEQNIVDLNTKNSPHVYQFDFPSDLCGQLIGRHGHNIRQIKEISGASIIIRRKSCTVDYQIVILEGTEEQVHSALKLIKVRFPEDKFPVINYSSSGLESHVPQPVQNVTAPPVQQDISQLILPAGVNSDVIVSRVISANHIFVQQLTHPSFPHLERQMQMMLQCYESDTETPGLPKPYEVGIVCVARIDNYWYRVQIVGALLDSDVCDVKLIDYGGYVQVQGSELKLIRRDFTMLPFQAIECYLYGVISPNDEEDFPPEASSLLIELVNGAVLQAQVVAVEEDQVPYVLLAKPVGNQSLDINRELVNRGVARWYEL